MSSSEQNIDISDNINTQETQDGERKKIENTKLKAIIRAFVANIGIALVKFVCFLFSRSSAMLAEAIHSGVDSFNSICLLVGIKRGSKPADSEHPFGYGLEANIWAMFASLLMLGGTFVALYHGFDKLINAHGIDELLKNYNYVAIALVASMCFEAWAVASATNAVIEEMQITEKNPIKKFFLSLKNIRRVQSPTTKFVWYEDTAAFLGVFIAFIALSLSKFVMPLKFAYIPDAIASIIIGLILLFLAIYLLKNNVSSLTVQSAEPRTEEIIRNVASTIHGITQVVELKTMNLGTSGLVINMTIEVDPETQMKDADDIAQMLERKIKKYVKNINDVTIELQAHDQEDNWEEKLDKLILEGERIGAIDNHEANMLSNFFSFANTVVKEIMIPRTEIVFADANSSIYEIADIIINSGHTRLPLYEDNVDNILGVINAKDVLKVIKNNNVDESFEIKSLARDILIVPENKFISDLLSDFTSSKNQIAAVIDEHGGIAGIVTIEDIIEEIVGEIYDEFDKIETPEVVKIDENTLDVSSKTSIDDLNERFDQDIPNEDFQTIGGYVFGLLGREPELGDVVEDKNITYTILELDGIKITRIKMQKNTPFIDNEENQNIEIQGE
ncbi:MAG: cation diffusion facilitator family transporter [Candidatus Gastranaerophilales bacterium]|nr:cation diffusion facilitator family transporter [Candidatus Gastranaerophilales bacterium]